MSRAGGTVVPIQPGVVSRVAGAVRGAIRGAADGWFGPGQPLAPVAPVEVAGRQWDFPSAINLNSGKPRGESGENAIDFPTLRALADPTQGGLDLLRLAIEKRKNQMAAQRWAVRGRDGSDGGSRARGIEMQLRKPDGVNSFGVWQRMLIEDHLVIDAPTVYFAPSTKGYRVPQVMDGATLKRLISLDGRTPLPPEPAFQQVLHGLPAVDYSLDDLVYAPRNLRSHRIYGMSPVEQVVMTVNIGIRRSMSQLEYYTAGSVPDVFLGAPETWNSEQIKTVQAWLDATLSGNTEERRRARLIPGGIQPFPMKPEGLKDLFDEWLARIICYCFDLSPQALVKETNRATAETGKQAAQEEGLEPVKIWFKEDVMDDVLARGFNAPELEFAYVDEEIANPVDKANVLSIALGRGGGKCWLTRDEVRAEYGKEPLTPEQLAELEPPAPEPVAPGEPASVDAEKVAKARRSLRPRPAPGR